MTQTPTTSQTSIDRHIRWFIGANALLAIILTALVGYIEISSGNGDVNWVLFGILSALLFVTETKSSSWMSFGGAGVVTASWTFTFALMLLGTPLGAIAVMAATTVTSDLLERKELRKVVFNTAQISLSLAIGAMVLFAFGIHGPILTSSTTPTSWAIAMMLSGVVVFSTNGIILCRLLAIFERTTFWTMMRNGFAVSMSADAAMLAMAPILVITAQNSLLMLPLIGTATYFVYQTARQAIQRSHEANHDPLTQLRNRRAFSDELDEFVDNASTSNRTGGIFILDLDRFKEINDRLGHRTGDHVLQAFSDRLVDALPDTATVARLGGDEFAVLLPDVSPADASLAAERLHMTLDEPLSVDGFPISAGTSIGVSHYPSHGIAPTELLHAADVAMYRSKRFRTGVETYEIIGSSQQKGRVTLLADLADAITKNEFRLDYQPQVELRTGHVTSVEALLRWDHPTLGLIAPDEFIGLAEQTDLIGPLTEFVLRTAIADASLLDPTIRVAVNVSARNLQDRHFAGEVLEKLAVAGFDPARLEMEITESAVALEPERMMASLEQLRFAGVRIAIDDFGTGYSSFSTLRELTVDRIKIDRSFIQHAVTSSRDRRIVQSVIDLAHSLELDVIAEGVETQTVWTMLCDAGCDVAQGYLIGRPESIQALKSRLLQSSENSILLGAPV